MDLLLWVPCRIEVIDSEVAAGEARSTRKWLAFSSGRAVSVGLEHFMSPKSPDLRVRVQGRSCDSVSPTSVVYLRPQLAMTKVMLVESSIPQSRS